MIAAEIPSDELSRLKDLNLYQLLDSRPEADFDELVELAGQICKCPISLVSLVDKDRQWFKARRGLEATETSRDIAFCSHAILQNRVMEVEDAMLDDRFHDNPLVTGDLNIRFYAGAPIISPTGFNLGTICVIDHKPKKLDKNQERALELLSKQATRLIDLRNKNVIIRRRADEIVSLKSKAITRALQENLQDKEELANQLHEELAQEIAACKMSLLNFKEIQANDHELFKLVKNQLQAILEKTKNLSYTLTPLSAKWIPMEELIGEFIDKVRNTYPIDLTYKFVGIPSTQPSIYTPLMIHLIEKWADFIAGKRAHSSLNITLHHSTHFVLTFTQEEYGGTLSELESDVNDCLLREIADIQGGKVDYSVSSSGFNKVEVVLPSDIE
jgi:signal transduction histidine kinase